jgi:hypothetical protein
MQKQHDCWWFGEFGKCRNFIILLVFAGFCAVTDVLLSVLMIWSGGNSAGASGSNSGNCSQSTPGEEKLYRYAVAAGIGFTDTTVMKTDPQELNICCLIPVSSSDFKVVNNVLATMIVFA